MFVHLQSRDIVLWMSFQRSAMSRIRINYRLRTLMKKSKIKICILWLNSAILLSYRRCIDFFATVVDISFRKLQNFIPFRSVPRIIIKKYNFLDCHWFKKLLFSTNSLAKLLSDSLISQSHLKLQIKSENHTESCSLNQPITTSVQSPYNQCTDC